MSQIKRICAAVLAACCVVVGFAEGCEHTFGPWRVETPASFVSAGTRVHTCSLCGEEFSEPYGPYTHPATDNAGCYVTDGLVHQWDGVRNVGAGVPHDSTATAWTDLVGSETLTLDSDGSASFTANALKRDTASPKPMALGASLNASGDDVKTVELVVKRHVPGTYAFLLSLGGANCGSGRGVIGMKNAYIGSNSHGFYSASGATTGDFVTVSFYSDGAKGEENLFVDGIAAAYNSNMTEVWSYADGQSGFILGGRQDSTSAENNFNGEIFACRMYSRRLDPFELAQNAAMDRARFSPCAHGDFGEWSIVTEATALSAGTRVHTCGKCGAEIVEPYGPLVGVVINEIVASNGSSQKTAKGDGGLDWIEIYNGTDAAVDLTGWKLTDNPDKPAKAVAIQHPVTIPAKGYQVIFVDKDYAGFTDAEPFARLGLSSSGETLALYDAGGNLVGETVAFPALMKDVSYGLKSGTVDGWGYFKTPTPGRANTEQLYDLAVTPKVTFSEPHGYKTEAFDVTLSCPENSGAAIYYTTDGSSPTTASTLYTGAIHIDHTTVLRAAVPTENALLQYDTSATYIFLEDVYQQTEDIPPAGFPESKVRGTGAVEKQTMHYGMRPDIVNGTADDRARLDRSFTNGIDTISIVIDPECLFNDTDGIYVNGYMKENGSWVHASGSKWERPMVLEGISPRATGCDFTIPSGLRLRGGYSRRGNHPKHAFRVLFNEKYGEGRLNCPLFGDEGADTFKKFDLRCSQNYSWGV